MQLDIVRNSFDLRAMFKFDLITICEQRKDFLTSVVLEEITEEDLEYLSHILTKFALRGHFFRRYWTVTPMVTYFTLSRRRSPEMLNFAEFALFRLGYFWLKLGKYEMLRDGFIYYGRRAYLDVSKRDEFDLDDRKLFKTSCQNFVAYAQIISELDKNAKKFDRDEIQHLLEVYKKYRTPSAFIALIRCGIPSDFI